MINRIEIADNFLLSEFQCKGGKCCGHSVKIDPNLVNILQQVRDYIGKPVHITSGYRCRKHNTAVGGAERSQHMLGTAADIYVDDVSMEQIADIADKIGSGGIGVYSNFVHVDTRDQKYRWRG